MATIQQRKHSAEIQAHQGTGKMATDAFDCTMNFKSEWITEENMSYLGILALG